MADVADGRAGADVRSERPFQVLRTGTDSLRLGRYNNESLRLYGVLDKRLEGRDYICGDYSIADMACWPWVITNKKQEIDLDAFPNVRRWYDLLKTRPALRRGYDIGKEFGRPDGKWDKEARKHLIAHTR